MTATAVALALFLGGAWPAFGQGGDPYNDAGMQYGATYFAPLPYERISTATGTLFLSFTDISLPGDAGFNLNIVRTYNSRDGRWRFGIGGVPLWGKFASSNNWNDIDFMTPDGGEHNFTGSVGTLVNQSFWRLTKSSHTLEFPNGIVAKYDHVLSGGAYLTEIRDPFDNLVTLTWESGQPHLEQLVQYVGGQTRTLVFTGWWTDIVNEISFAGRYWQYEWETMSATPSSVLALEWARLPASADWTFSYTNDSTGALKLSDFTTPNGATISYTWGSETFPTTPSSRVVVKSRTTGGRVPSATWNLDWQSGGTTLEIEGPANRVVYHTVQEDGELVASSRSIEALGGGPVRSETLTYESIPTPAGDVPALKTRTTVQDGLTFTTTYSYSSQDFADYGQPNQVEEVGQLSRTTAITYRHDFSKYIKGRVASVTSTVGSETHVRSSTYNTNTGFLTSSTASGLTTTFEADGGGNVASVTNAAGQTTSFTHQWGIVKNTSTPVTSVTRTINDDGTVASETVGGLTTTFGYDQAGRLTSLNAPGVPALSKVYVRDAGPWTRTIVTQGSSSIVTDIDGFGRTTETEDGAGVKTRTTYSGAGRVTYASYPFDAGTPETGETYGYDALGRRTAVTPPAGTMRWWDFGSSGGRLRVRAGRHVSLPADVRITTTFYEAFGDPSEARLVEVQDPAGGVWSYTYNVAGQLKQVQSNVAPTRTVGVYDSRGFLVSSTHPESGTTTFVVDNAGNVTQRQDARGIAVSFAYDGGNRLTAVDAPGAADDVSVAYDAAGRVASTTNGTATTTFVYDAAGRPSARTDTVGGLAFTQQYAHDANGNVSEVTYPGGARKVLYDYGTQGRLTQVRTSVGGGTATVLASNIQYHASGAIRAYTLGNGQVRSVTFDPLHRPSRLVDGPLDVTYGYDYLGNVSSTDDVRAGFDSTYGYDALDRLTSVTGFGATTYSYNGAGDRLHAGSVNYAYDATTRRLMSLSGGATGSFSYDATGSMTADPDGGTYTYDALGMMTTAQVGGSTTTYKYDPGGSRAVKVNPNGSQQIYLNGPGSALLAEYELSGATLALKREYVYLGGQLLASIAPDSVTVPAIGVAITSPTGGTAFGAGETFNLTAAATIPAGVSIARVEYYNGGTLIGQATAAPFTVPFTVVHVGGPSLFRARLVTATNHAVVSAPITINFP